MHVNVSDELGGLDWTGCQDFCCAPTASLPFVSRGRFQCTVLQGLFLPCLVVSRESL